jgi:hypothetical protein
MLIEKLCGIFTPKEDSNNDWSYKK